MSKVQTIFLLFESLVFGAGGPDLQSDPLRLHSLLATIFAWCLVWGLGGNLDESCNDKFDSYVKDLLSDCPDIKVSKHILIILIFIVVCSQSILRLYSILS